MNKSRHTLQSRIRRTVGKTIREYDLIHDGDRILVAVSGGKDSWTMLHLLMHFRRVSPVSFELIPVTIHPGYPDFPVAAIEAGYRRFASDLPWTIVRTRMDRTIREKNTPGKYPCAFCARLRRGALYKAADTHRCNRIALGHHADDAIETVLISSMFEGRLVSLPPRFKVEKHPLTVIRPLIRTWEADISRYSMDHDFPAVSCGHEDRSGGIRATVKKLLEDIRADHPEAGRYLLASLQNIDPGRFLDSKWL